MKLASIETIGEILPHKNAERLEIAEFHAKKRIKCYKQLGCIFL